MRRLALPGIDGSPELRGDVEQLEGHLVQWRLAAFAVPAQAVTFPWRPLTFDDQAQRIGGALRGMGHTSGQQKHAALWDRDVGQHTVTIRHTQDHVARELEEQLFPGIDVKILATVGTAHDHDDEVPVFEQTGVAHRRPKLVAVPLDPAGEIDRAHPGSIRPPRVGCEAVPRGSADQAAARSLDRRADRCDRVLDPKGVIDVHHCAVSSDDDVERKHGPGHPVLSKQLALGVGDDITRHAKILEQIAAAVRLDRTVDGEEAKPFACVLGNDVTFDLR